MSYVNQSKAGGVAILIAPNKKTGAALVVFGGGLHLIINFIFGIVIGIRFIRIGKPDYSLIFEQSEAGLQQTLGGMYCSTQGQQGQHTRC